MDAQKWKALLEYSESWSTPGHASLYELERQTFLQTVAPQMISGKTQGRLLSLISKLKKPKRILEIGTFTGYSALCLAEGLDENGVLHTIEVSRDYDHIRKQFASAHPAYAKIQWHLGDALDIVPRLGAEWDLVFLDAAKNKYLDFLKMLEPQMALSGLLIADNVLWYGKVLDSLQDEETRILDSFNKTIYASPNWQTLLVPVRDGISVSMKTSNV